VIAVEGEGDRLPFGHGVFPLLVGGIDKERVAANANLVTNDAAEEFPVFDDAGEVAACLAGVRGAGAG
jgi:hypothetical protein